MNLSPRAFFRHACVRRFTRSLCLRSRSFFNSIRLPTLKNIEIDLIYYYYYCFLHVFATRVLSVSLALEAPGLGIPSMPFGCALLQKYKSEVS